MLLLAVERFGRAAGRWLLDIPFRLILECAAPLGIGLLFALTGRLLAAASSDGDAAAVLVLLPAVAMTGTAIAGLMRVASLPLHRRLEIAVAAAVESALLVSVFGLEEVNRLAVYWPAVDGRWVTLLPLVDLWIAGGAITAILVCGWACRLALGPLRAVTRARHAVLGDADWMTIKDAAKLFPEDGEIVIGERYRVDESRVRLIPFDPADRSSWGPGGRKPLLTYKLNFDSTHMLFFAGSGGFKTTSVVVPTAVKYSGPLICLDPSSEVAPMVVSHRKAMGRRVMVLDPRGTDRDGFNVLDWIGRTKTRDEDIAAFAQMLLSESAKIDDATGTYFQNQAHNLLTGLLAHVMEAPDYAGRRTLRSLREIVSQPEPNVLMALAKIQDGSASKFIRETLGVFTNMTEQTFSGVYSTASKDTQWLSLEAYCDMVCGSTFNSADLADGKTDVFINIPASMLRTYPGIGRVIIGSLVNAMIQADGRHKARAVFCLDEVDLLGYMKLLEDARDRGRKYGVTLMLFYQSVGQLERHFGKSGATSWFEGAAFASYAAIKSLDTARDVSAKCGDYTVEMHGESRSVGASAGFWGGKGTVSRSAQRRPLILPHEVTQTMRADEQIVIVHGHPPLRCGRALYFRRGDMRDLVGRNRFAGTSKEARAKRLVTVPAKS